MPFRMQSNTCTILSSSYGVRGYLEHLCASELGIISPYKTVHQLVHYRLKVTPQTVRSPQRG